MVTALGEYIKAAKLHEVGSVKNGDNISNDLTILEYKYSYYLDGSGARKSGRKME